MLYGRCASSYNILNTEILSAVIEFFNRTFEIGPNVRSMVHTDRGVAYCSMIIQQKEIDKKVERFEKLKNCLKF